MPTKSMTYDELAAAWGVTKEAARKKVEKYPKTSGNDGKARVMIDLDEVPHQPLKREKKASPDRAETEALRQHVQTLQGEIERMTALAATNRADFELERQRAEQALGDLVRLTSRLTEAEQDRAGALVEAEKARAEQREISAAADRTAAELAAWKERPWWRRALG